MKKIILLTFILINCLQSNAQTSNPSFHEVDSTVRLMHIKSLQPSEIALQVTASFKSDLEKVRAIFIWLTENIAYDCEKMRQKPSERSTDLKKVLKKKTGICGDYAQLFAEMCETVDIEAGVIVGYSRNQIREIGKTPKRPLHAWNWVKIDEKTYLLDATWASGYADCKKTMEFHKAFNEAYFLTPPEAMILDHYPIDSQLQLLNTNISLENFGNLPLIGNGFTKYDIKNYAPHQGYITTTQDSLKIRIDFENPPKQVFLQFDRKMTGYDLEIKNGKIEFDLELPVDRPRKIVLVAYDEQNYSDEILIYRLE